MGGLSRAFDLVSCEYGWGDSVILDLTLKRLRQITTAITLRKYLEERKQRSLITWQTQTLSVFIAAASGAGEDFVKQAASVSLDQQDEEEQKKSKEPEPGSYERLMANMVPGLTRAR